MKAVAVPFREKLGRLCFGAADLDGKRRLIICMLQECSRLRLNNITIEIMKHKDARGTGADSARITLAWCASVGAFFEAAAPRRNEGIIDGDRSTCCSLSDDDVAATIDVVWSDGRANKSSTIVLLRRDIDIDSNLTILLGWEAALRELVTSVVWAIWPSLVLGQSLRANEGLRLLTVPALK